MNYCSKIHVRIKQPLTLLYCSSSWMWAGVASVTYSTVTLTGFCSYKLPRLVIQSSVPPRLPLIQRTQHNSAVRQAGNDASKNSSERCLRSISSTPCLVLRRGRRLWWKTPTTRHHICILKMERLTFPLHQQGCAPCAGVGGQGDPHRDWSGVCQGSDLQFPTQRFAKSTLSCGSPLWK